MRLVDEVLNELRDRIYSGHYLPGQRMRQEQLAAELAVSRTPLREALRILERERLVTLLPNGGLQVIVPDPGTLLSAYQLREMLDGLAARIAAEQANHDALCEQLHLTVDRQSRALDPWDDRAWTNWNVEFHTRLLRASGNDFLVAQLPLIRMTAQVFVPVKMLVASRAVEALEEHREILAAVQAGDSEAAEKAARAHIRRTIDRLLKRFSQPSRVAADDG